MWEGKRKAKWQFSGYLYFSIDKRQKNKTWAEEVEWQDQRWIMNDVNCGQRIHIVQVGMNICQQVSSRAGLKKTTKAWTPGYLLDVNIYKKEDHNRKEKAKLLSKVFYVFNLLISEHTWCNTGPLQTGNASLNVKWQVGLGSWSLWLVARVLGSISIPIITIYQSTELSEVQMNKAKGHY